MWGLDSSARVRLQGNHIRSEANRSCDRELLAGPVARKISREKFSDLDQ